MKAPGSQQVRKGMEVYTSDGSSIGRVGEVHPPAADARTDVAPRSDDPNLQPGGLEVRGDQLDLDITGDTDPLGRNQPTQRELGVDPTPETAVEEAGRAEAGTDFRSIGEAGDRWAAQQSPGDDPRETDGYFRLDTGLDSTDLYVPLSAAAGVSGGRLMLNFTRDQLNTSGWQDNPRSGR